MNKVLCVWEDLLHGIGYRIKLCEAQPIDLWAIDTSWLLYHRIVGIKTLLPIFCIRKLLQKYCEKVLLASCLKKWGLASSYCRKTIVTYRHYRGVLWVVTPVLSSQQTGQLCCQKQALSSVHFLQDNIRSELKPKLQRHACIYYSSKTGVTSFAIHPYLWQLIRILTGELYNHIILRNSLNYIIFCVYEPLNKYVILI